MSAWVHALMHLWFKYLILTGDHYYEDLTAESLENILDELVAGKQPSQGPKNGRFSSEPLGGAIALSKDLHLKSIY